MRFLTHEEAIELARSIAKDSDLDQRPYSVLSELPAVRVAFEKEPGYRYFWLARQLVHALGPFEWCLAWVTEAGIFPSNENWQLYYAWRQSLGERTHLEDRPAHKVLEHEEAALISLVHLAMLSGWDMVLLTSHDYGRVFVSHDGWAEAAVSNPDLLSSVEKSLAEAKLEVAVVRPAS